MDIKEQIIGGKVTKEEKELIEKAADKERRTISSFIVKSSLDRAKEILREE
jgi:uncharacterized protein (DUF1778 family)